ncbi:unnamed protein product [Strongylus vulgaris]|uniref:Focal AT domain-containing protein n=1 Tax=Strongylus vulgaris TaxID=40348 RepID=A0A3P7IEF8_STRVU|nr:unnamed protein product [Strongylus vulgaris]
MKHDEFVSSIRDITSKLREMFAESTDVLGQMPEDRRKEVEMSEALIGNDMRQMGKVVQQVVDNTNNPVSFKHLSNNAVLLLKTRWLDQQINDYHWISIQRERRSVCAH